MYSNNSKSVEWLKWKLLKLLVTIFTLSLMVVVLSLIVGNNFSESIELGSVIIVLGYGLGVPFHLLAFIYFSFRRDSKSMGEDDGNEAGESPSKQT